ncbi:hypothetical protein FF38_05488 [Lucilia cuprina]|uniref:Uncharacterized protein n=1 Tax=Lucilia cuprina TaxID=7375 RepID=A0A0L0BTB9_LUCCU|nr:hypothetical protein FF38_05488 [Lucilia cuprina]
MTTGSSKELSSISGSSSRACCLKSCFVLPLRLRGGMERGTESRFVRAGPIKVGSVERERPYGLLVVVALDVAALGGFSLTTALTMLATSDTLRGTSSLRMLCTSYVEEGLPSDSRLSKIVPLRKSTTSPPQGKESELIRFDSRVRRRMACSSRDRSFVSVPRLRKAVEQRRPRLAVGGICSLESKLFSSVVADSGISCVRACVLKAPPISARPRPFCWLKYWTV